MASRGKTIMFVDNSNIFHGSQQAGWRIDAKKLHAKIETEGPIWQTFFFAAVSDPPRYNQTSFYKILKNDLHYEMTVLPLGSKTVRCVTCGDRRRSFTEKGIDVALATKLLVLANNRAFETAILVSGDKDYLETIKAVKSLGMRVEVVSWKQSLSQDLGRESSRSPVLLDDLRAEIEKAAPDVEVERLMTPEDEG
jgi:uncharacterized LabA/DUF88 family protein